MTTCHGCGGTIGRDCFNPQECEEITRQQAAAYRESSQQQQRPVDQTPLYLACVEALNLIDTYLGQAPYGDRYAEAVRKQLVAAIEQHAGGPVDAGGERI